MCSLFIRRKTKYICLAFGLFSTLFFCISIHASAAEQNIAQNNENNNIDSSKENNKKLAEAYQAAIAQAYQELSGDPAFILGSTELSVLLSKIKDAQKNKKSEYVLGLIINNIGIIKNNSNNKNIPDIVNIALQNHSLSTAQNIRLTIEAQAPRTITATCDYEIANYLAKQNAWDDALTILKTIDLSNDLSSIDADNAFIIWGAALQHTKKHRQALEYYQRVKNDSPLYPLAQLDIALVYIRQDWWTDAQIAMQSSIKANGEKFDEFTNRVYTTLGFSQLQQGFYRNARDNFRKVKIKSEYADQALLGLGMAALNQEDFLGAFNAFDQLKKHQQKTTPIEQSYLMAAFTLAKLKQNKSAASAYAEAQIYYEQRVKMLSNIASQLSSSATNDFQAISENLVKEGVKESSDSISYAFQLKTLGRLLSFPISERAKSNIATAYSTIFSAYQHTIKSDVDAKILILNSYLNQSRFGLTKLYDTP